MKCRRLCVIVLLASSALLVVHVDAAEFVQQGPKLVGTVVRAGNPQQGSAAALSADGNTAVVGSYGDELYTGAVWVFTRNGEAWSQQGPKLVGTGAQGAATQGASVAVSRDGNTAIVGGPGDSPSFLGGAIGATWVFQRANGVWTQQGPKLVGTGGDVQSEQGDSAAISGDGNTIIVGGAGDDAVTGAAWVFARSAGVWSQQGQKLVGTGSVGQSLQGDSVALSDDGNTAVVGGSADNTDAGAAWIFTRSGGVWSQQGPKLVGAGAVGIARQGVSVAISADGNTAIVGGTGDNSNVGAVWVFTRTGATWTQQGPKLVGAGAIGESWQGKSVSISADGNTAVVGGDVDSALTGAAWIFVRNETVWRQQGTKLVGTGAVGAARQGTSVALSGDARTAAVGGIWDNAELGAVWVYSANLPPPIAVPTLEAIVAFALCAIVLLSGLWMLRRRGDDRLGSNPGNLAGVRPRRLMLGILAIKVLPAGISFYKYWPPTPPYRGHKFRCCSYMRLSNPLTGPAPPLGYSQGA